MAELDVYDVSRVAVDNLKIIHGYIFDKQL